MGLVQWATSPWGREVPIHIAFGLLWVSAIGGVLFLIAHALYVGYWTKSAETHAGATGDVSPAVAARIPERVARHSFGARLFHGVMALSMFTLLFTAFLPKLGVKFAWVTYHWIAGVVLTIAVIYHLFHATFWLDFWSIWPDRVDIEDAGRRFRRALGDAAPPPRKFAKYPLENKLYHLAILCAGLAVIGTGVLMMSRVRTPFFTRDPYLFGFSDMTWGWMYVLHGLSGIALVALITVHVYFALRPEKLFITKSMIFGWMSREKYLEHHDPERWPIGEEASEAGPSRSREVPA
jgi:cytochrome b subunit of formate dehydrogenase